ncbi:cysteine peptidase family C39 domain-containing protein [Pedobacter sp. Du54]|uniref:cysteine peptidase family C39 domain-containing protein n=1 Tax=Pedobacter anseongensis TaxID=3133439 RepID=UPI0030AD1138
MDCGPTFLRMVAKHFGKNYSIQRLREICGINREGVSLLGISEAAEKIGFRTSGAKVNLETLDEVSLPVILHWRQNHFVVLYRIKNKKYYISDPSSGLIIYTHEEFLKL